MSKRFLYLIFAVLVAGCSKKTVPHQDPLHAHDRLTIASSFVQEDRIINVWTPPTYAQSTDPFPVLYMPDGGIKEDFPHIANTLAKLVAAEEIPPFILVGIENTERGRDLTGFSDAEYDKQYLPVTDGAKDFRAFISEELIPEIESKYRTSNKKGIIGESLAGLFVMETFLIKPGIFDFYIAMDPSLWWDDHYLVDNAEALLAKLPAKPLTLWFAGSDAEDIYTHTRALESTLKLSSPGTLTWKYSDEPNERHNTIFRSTKEKALIWTLNQ